ncbi:MAG: ribosome biogenesis GTP-binding protein YihA/YsxC [Bacteroidia bacterium]|nr:ribosome biogenesis GTP-binding protein YihA/YsxC [Bacteroidia bacterium]
MEISSANYLISAANMSQLAPPAYPEYAFVGRSNVGKSSFINCLCNRKNLAHTSATPGKTQTVNLYLINEAWVLADLPGFGYARTNKTQREKFAKLIIHYIEKRESLMNVFLLIDGRLVPQDIDKEFVQYMGEAGIPFSIVFTKIDDTNQKSLAKISHAWEDYLSATWDELPPVFFTSARSGRGRKEVLAYIAEMNPLWVPVKTYGPAGNQSL